MRLAGAVAMLLAAAPAEAQNRGVYPLGMSATNSGVTAEPGFTYVNQLLTYARDHVKDDAGETLPNTGSNTVIMDMNTLAWVSRTRIAGARYSASATIPVAKNNLTSDIHGPISGGSGLADSYYLPFILGWKANRAAVRAMYGFLAPTGRFAANATNNVGAGYWTHTASSGQTFSLTTDKRLVLSAFQMYEFHTTQAETGARPGDTFDLDYSVMLALPKSDAMQWQIGVVGYGARQTTARTGPGVTPKESAERYAVNALGAAASVAFAARVSAGVKYFHEFANRSTYQGYSLQFTGSVSF